MKTATKTKTSILSFTSKPLTLVSCVLTASLLMTACSDNDGSKSDADVNANTGDSTEPVAVENPDGPVEEAAALNADEPINDSVENETSMPSSNINPMTTAPEQPSLVTNPTEPGTPEDTVKQALNTLYYGDVEDAVDYYKVDMANFEQELANTQSAFQQTVESVTITNTQYSVDKLRVTITGELKLKGQSEPAPLTYELRKVNGQWKILG